MWRSMEACLFCSSGWSLRRKKLFLVLVLEVTWGSGILDLSLYFISGEKKKKLWRGAVKLQLSLGRGPVSPTL